MLRYTPRFTLRVDEIKEARVLHVGVITMFKILKSYPILLFSGVRDLFVSVPLDVA